MSQLSIFDIMFDKYKIDKKIRLVELFAGYGSQALALKYLGANFEHYKICEWATKSIQAYNDLHVRDYTDYASWKSMDYIYNFLYEKGISLDYNSPMTLDQIKRKGESWCKTVYNNIIATKNLVNITKVKAADLCIEDTNKYTYIMTYSFPCQDLSIAGLTKGMEKGSGTRSGLLWEVERILEECGDNKPQVLLMENVTQVHGSGNEKSFSAWVKKLEELGYSNYIQDMIATDYCIPQTRDRTFMVSILGNYAYNFPQPMKLPIKLKDLLEKEVPEKFYLTNKQIEEVKKWKAHQKPLETMEKIEKSNILPTQTTRTSAYTSSMLLIKEPLQKTNENLMVDKKDSILKKELCNQLIKDNLVEDGDIIQHNYTKKAMSGNKKCVEKNDGNMITLTTRGDTIGVCVKTIGNYSPSNHNASRIIDSNYVAPTVMENHGTITGIKEDLRIRKLTPKECWRLMGVKDSDFNLVCKNQSDASLYHLAGDSIVTSILIGTFGELLQIDYKQKILELIQELKEE